MNDPAEAHLNARGPSARRPAWILLLAGVLVACGGPRGEVKQLAEVEGRDRIPSIAVQGDAPPAWDDRARSDGQGAVEVVVVPLNLNKAGEVLEFEIRMDTHSVDLSMDLSALATLTTDTGATLQPLSWSGGGGHHVSGVLTFSARDASGSPALAGSSRLTLTILNLDAAQRVFEWNVNSEP